MRVVAITLAWLFWRHRRKRSTNVGGDLGKRLNAETIEVALDEVRRTFEDEEHRGRHLDSKGLQLLGFAGVIFTLTATLGSPLKDVPLGDHREPVAYLFVASLVILVLAALASVLAVRPAKYLGLDEDALELFAYEPRIYDPPWQLRGDILLGLMAPLRTARQKNDRKAKWVKRATALIAFSLLVVAMQAAIVGLHASGVLVSDSSKKEPPKEKPATPAKRTPPESSPFRPVPSRPVHGGRNKDDKRAP